MNSIAVKVFLKEKQKYKENKLLVKVFEIDKNKPLFEQEVCQETKDFIAALNLLYWEKNK